MAGLRDSDIEKWQDSLFEAFSYQGVLGGRYLGPVMAAEPLVGRAFTEKYYGHRVLTDSFLDFFCETLSSQFDVVRSIGWPIDKPYYATCLTMFLTMFRSYRSAEVISTGGYPLQGYIIQRSLKDQAFALCAVANGTDTLASLFGWDTTVGSSSPADLVKRRQKVEDGVVRHLIGKTSGLSEGTQEQLLNWNRLFNWEAHRGLLTFGQITGQLIAGELPPDIAPTNDELLESMYLNRCSELGWMILRLLPYVRRVETPRNAEWDRKWMLLDGSFKMMIDGLGSLGKKIAPAFIEFVQSKFNFSPQIYYFEQT